jgi:trimeric autotransporter adhesin
MKFRTACVLGVSLSLALLLAPTTFAQTTAETTSPRPRLVRFSGTAKDLDGNPQTGVIGITFALYSEQTGGAALWLETQNVTADNNGHYAALLGSTKPDGLPTDLFTTEQARWVGVQVSGQAEQPRVLLLSVPYALKAADAETLGGKPASAYLLNPQSTPALPTSTQSIPVAASKAVPNSAQSANSASISGSGTTNYLPRWTSSTNLGNSIIFQSTASKLGIGTTSPLATLDIRESTGMRAIASGNVTAVYGNATVASGTGKGVEGDTSSTSGTGVAGVANATTGSTQGMWGANFSKSGVGVLGQSYATSGSAIGVEGLSASSAGTAGVFNNTGGGKVLSGQTNGTEVFSVDGNGVTQVGVFNSTPTGILNATSTSTTLAAVSGTGVNDNNSPGPGLVGYGGTTIISNSTTGGAGIIGNGGTTRSNGGPGVIGNGGQAGPSGLGGTGVLGIGGSTTVEGTGVEGESGSTGIGIVGSGGIGVSGATTGALQSSSGAGILGVGAPPDPFENYAGDFSGDVAVSGTLTASTKDFKIDHPLDPANKYLLHASVESSEMKNIYDGNVITNDQGQATVQLPKWFQALNTDFRYQLTVIGQFAQAIVAQEIENNHFEIKTSAPNVKVSWQVTGVRQDAYAKANPLVVEQEKESRLRGFYTHPELYGAPPEKQIEWARHPQMMKKIQEMRAKQLAAVSRVSQSR